MRQQVNLYTIEFRRHEQPLSSRTLLWSLAALLLVLVVWESVNAWQFLAADKALAVLEQDVEQLAGRLEQLKAARPASQRSALEREVEALRIDIQRRQELRALISQQNPGNALGFSPLLEALARQSQEDIWLTRIGLLGGGRDLEMAGWTRQAASVPFYLQQLRTEQAFADVKFGVLSIRGQEAGQPYLHFSLLRTEDAVWPNAGK